MAEWKSSPEKLLADRFKGLRLPMKQHSLRPRYASTCSFASLRFLSSSFSFPKHMLWPLLSWPHPIRPVVVTAKLVAARRIHPPRGMLMMSSAKATQGIAQAVT